MKLENVSASQIKTYTACKRKWHWEKIAGHRGPPSEAMARGTAIHHAIEYYINTGTILSHVSVLKYDGEVIEPGDHLGDHWEFRTDFYVEAAIPFIPEGSKAETDFILITDSGLPWLGVIDLKNRRLILLKDWKSTSSLRWAKTPEELRKDPQANSYALAVCREYGEIGVDVCFVYFETSAKTKTQVQEVEVHITLDEAQAYWAGIQPTINDMVEDAKVIDTLSLPPTVSECSKYGGCPHRGRCGLSGLIGLYETGGKKKMSKSMQDLMADKRKLAGPDLIVPDDAPSPEVQPGDVAKEAKKKSKKKAPRKSKTRAGATIYVDCAPVKGVDGFTLFEEWVQPAIAIANEIAAKAGSVDWRMMGYAPEKLAFQTAIEKVVEEGLPDAMVMSSWHPQAKEALAVLMLHAVNVVRGLR